jgi:guanylate kinase
MFEPDSNFSEQIDLIETLYSTEVINLLRENKVHLKEGFSLWEEALRSMAKKYNIKNFDIKLIPSELETASLAQLSLSTDGRRGFVFGFAGPGATGKETLASELGWPKVINTTTRSPRGYEKDGVHYNFVDKAQFKIRIENNSFVDFQERKNRGWYGIEKTSIEKAFDQSSEVIVEENPRSLVKLSQKLKEKLPSASFCLVYILPPFPVFLHLAARLAKRCIGAGDKFDSAVIDSTLGNRQVEEFLSLNEAREAETSVVILVNDEISRAAQVLRKVSS